MASRQSGNAFVLLSAHQCLLLLQLPGANAGKPDVGAAAKDAAKKTPFGFMNMGDLAFDLPGSNVSKDDLPNNVKPGDAAGLPKGPTAKPPSGPSLPKVCSNGLRFCLQPKGSTCVANSMSRTQNFPRLEAFSFTTLKYLCYDRLVSHLLHPCNLDKQGILC